ncbi:MAG: VWA domain-containing protein [Candidatus Riesia sp.]|nr:VWA domain-containing protein [Candidatus Riesia sp.]
MSVNLIKAESALKVVLEKKTNGPLPIVPITTVIDCSGSMEHNYINGNIQYVLEQLLVIALKLDDDGQLPVVLFSNKSTVLKESLNITNITNYLRNQIQQLFGLSYSLWYGTEYLPAMKNIVTLTSISLSKNPTLEKIVQFCYKIPFLSFFAKFLSGFLPKTDSLKPSVCFFITDGEPQDDWGNIKSYIQRHSKNIFWVFVCIDGTGDECSRNLQNFNNTDVVKLTSIVNDNDVLYDKIITQKLLSWIQQFN